MGLGQHPEDAKAIIDAFMDRGGNFIDTANMYTKGHSEKIIGDHIGVDTAKRAKAVIATKFTGNLFRNDPNGGGAGRKAIIQQCEESLRRLQTDYIDLYWMHVWDHNTPIDETLRALQDLVSSGKVRYIGVSDTPAWKVAQAQMLAEMKGWSPFIGLQIEYSLLERTVEGELMPMARELGLGVTPWSPLKSGVLSGKYRRGQENNSDRGDWANMWMTEETFKVIDVLLEAAEALDSTPARVALNWVQTQPGVTSTIVGARRLGQLEDNLAALDLDLTPEFRQKLDEVTTPALPFPINFVNNMGPFFGNGTTINGETHEVFPLSPESDKERH